jgi:hypothetical protein
MAVGLFGQVDSAYGRHRERMAGRAAEDSRTARDIGPIPPVETPDRREACRLDLRMFCETYFPQIFQLAWSPDHIRVIGLIESAVLRGQLAAVAMPRGSGKTSLLAEVSPIWATLYSHCRYTVIIGAENDHARQIIEAILVQLETNERLAADFPEVCYPIRRLEGIRQRAAGQLSRGWSTRIRLTERKLVMPTVENSLVSGSVIQAAGITGRIRGMKHALADGSSVRPDLVLIDDPQTDESAKSPSQIQAREAVVDNAILGLAGPGKSIAGLAAITVIEPDDLADRLLNVEKHPEWRAERCRALYEFPTRMDLWEAYGELYRAGLPTGDTETAAAFYRDRRAEMDLGARVAWEARYKPDEASALEGVMRVYLAKPAMFFAELQNEPIREGVDEETAILKPDEVQERVSGVPRGLVPDEAEFLTAFADVQGRALFWVAIAYGKGFDAWIVDYGTEPDQGRAYFTLRDIKRTLKRAAPGAGQEGAITAGLERLASRLLDREWKRHSGGVVPLDLFMVDANWSTETVFSWARSTRHAARVMPSRGRYYGASSKPIHDRTKKRGDRIGPGWFIAAPGGRRAIREVVWDTNFWKSFTWARLTTPRGDRAALWLPGTTADAKSHRMLAEHLTAEERQRVTSSGGRTVDEWKVLRGRDNHLLDGVVGCCVAASVVGAALLEGERREAPRERARPTKSLRELQAERRAGR